MDQLLYSTFPQLASFTNSHPLAQTGIEPLTLQLAGGATTWATVTVVTVTGSTAQA